MEVTKQTIADYKAIVKRFRNNHTLHVALLLHEGLTKSEATIIAYVEAAIGLSLRTNPIKETVDETPGQSEPVQPAANRKGS